MILTCLLCSQPHSVEKWEADYAPAREAPRHRPAYVCPACAARVNRDVRQRAPIPGKGGPQ